LDLPLLGDLRRTFGVEIAGVDKLSFVLRRQSSMDPRVLLAQVADADDCGT
jgi:hypothetical protein